MDFILIYITFPNEEEARKISRHLIQQRLIACVNVHPITSLYWWEGKIADEKEWVVIAKTRSENWDTVRTEVENLHSYTTPCIIRIPVRSNQAFYDWLEKETHK
jgi:periplasmic divalent cation tolerance protein